jgi:hypothetical protein
MRRTLLSLLPLGLALLLAPQALAEPGRFDLGIRGTLVAADGEPANDIPGAGLFGHYQWNDRWRLGVGVDQAEYDFEEPARLLGLVQSASIDPVDVIAESLTLSVSIERTYGSSGRTLWFWGVGLGFATIDVPDAVGPLASGGRFDIRTEADSEIVASLLAGVSRRLGERWALEFGVRADQHFADWQVTDRVSGRTGAVDDYLALGGYLGVSFRF